MKPQDNSDTELREQIADCFKRTHMQTEGDTELFDTDLTIDEIVKVVRKAEQEAERREREKINKAWRPLKAALIAYSHKLDVPFTDAPDKSPWTEIKQRASYLEAHIVHVKLKAQGGDDGKR